MGQSQPFSVPDENAWLSGLVDTMEHVEQIHYQPCDKALLSAAMSRLQLPAYVRRDMTRRGLLLELSF